MSRIPALRGKENYNCCMAQPMAKVKIKRPLLDLPVNVRVRSRSTSTPLVVEPIVAGVYVRRPAPCCKPPEKARSPVLRSRSTSTPIGGEPIVTGVPCMSKHHLALAERPAPCCRLPQNPKSPVLRSRSTSTPIGGDPIVTGVPCMPKHHLALAERPAPCCRPPQNPKSHVQRSRSTSTPIVGEPMVAGDTCMPNHHLALREPRIVKRRSETQALPRPDNVDPGTKQFDFDFAKKRIPCCKPLQEAQRVQQEIPIHKTAGSRRPVKVKRRSSSKNCLAGELPYVGDIYNMEYLHDIITLSKKKEERILLAPKFMERFCHNAAFRTNAVKWMESLQVPIRFSNEVFYLSVNILDQVMARAPFQLHKYKMVLLTIIWTVNKLIGDRDLFASDLICYYAADYQSQHMSAQERVILKLLDYSIHTIEPSIYVNYYLKIFKIADLKVAHEEIHLVLHRFVRHPEYSCFPCSLIAVAALSVVVKFYFPDLGPKLDYYFCRHLGGRQIAIKQKLESLMSPNV